MSNKSTKSKIISLPHPSLRKPSQKVGVITNEIVDVTNEMINQALAWEDEREHEVAVALAAVQINQLYKIIIIREDFDDRKNKEFVTLLNPEITKRSGAEIEDYEGCLSVKDYYAKVPRFEKIKVKARSLENKTVNFSADGFLARVIQHEIDHTKGFCTVDRVKDLQHGFKILTDEGKLEPATFQQVEASGILKDL